MRPLYETKSCLFPNFTKIATDLSSFIFAISYLRVNFGFSAKVNFIYGTNNDDNSSGGPIIRYLRFLLLITLTKFGRPN